VPVCEQEHERYYPTPPHPTPAVTDQPRGLVCLCVHRNMNVITPPHPTGNWSAKSSACVCRTARKMIRLLCLSVHRNMNVITPPHPIPRKVPVSAGEKKDYKVCCVCVCTGTWTLLAHPTPPHPIPRQPCVYRWTRYVCTDEPEMCVQMTLICVRRWPSIRLKLSWIFMETWRPKTAKPVFAYGPRYNNVCIVFCQCWSGRR